MEEYKPIVSEEKQTELTELCIPIIEWINKNMHPHAKVIIDCQHGELVEGVTTHWPK